MPTLAGARAFLSSVTGVLILALLAALLIQTARIEGFKLWPLSITGYKAKLADAKAELARISTAKNDQAKVTTVNIVKAREADTTAKRVAERIRAEPVKACETGSEIMGADL